MIIIPLLSNNMQQPYQKLTHALWGTDASRYQCQFRIGHFKTGLLLDFEVNDPEIIAQKRPFNDSVHLDNCVEMFIKFAGDEGYYNFEINCLGSVKAAYGADRHEREYLPFNQLQQIQNDLRISIQSETRRVQANGVQTQGAHWKISIRLNLSLFSHTPIETLQGTRACVNFTKCGGSTENNYLSLVDIDTIQPDFHCPECFCPIVFG